MSGVGGEIKTIISSVEGDIIAVGEAAWAQTKAELAVLADEVLSTIKADIETVLSKVESGSTVEMIETELLNLWGADKDQIISALSSGALQVLIAMAKTALALA